MKLKQYQICFRAFNHRKRRIRKKYFNILLKIDKNERLQILSRFIMSRRQKYKHTTLKDYTLALQMFDSVNTIRFYGTEEEMMRLVNLETRAYCVRGIEVTHYNFDNAENSDDGYIDFYDIFPQFKKKEVDSL